MNGDRPVRVYVASKTCHGPEWVRLRDSWRVLAAPVEIISTWIDESDPGQTLDTADLWTRCVAEARSCDLLIAHHHPDEVWKGAFVEIGAALALGRPVYVIGSPPGSWVYHPLVREAKDVIDALRDFTERSEASLDEVTP